MLHGIFKKPFKPFKHQAKQRIVPASQQPPHTKVSITTTAFRPSQRQPPSRLLEAESSFVCFKLYINKIMQVSTLLFLASYTTTFMLFICIIVCSSLFFIPLNQGSANFFFKEPDSIIFIFGCHKDTVTTTQLCCCNVKAALDNTETNRPGSVSTKLQ